MPVTSVENVLLAVDRSAPVDLPASAASADSVNPTPKVLHSRYSENLIDRNRQVQALLLRISIAVYASSLFVDLKA